MSRGWQMVVKDSDYLSGPSVAGVIRIVSICSEAHVVVVDEVEGRGEVRSSLVASGPRLFSARGLATLAEKMTQFEWGDFFFFRTEDEWVRIRPEDSCPIRVSKAVVSVRCVDNTYFYLYGADEVIRMALQDRLQVSESRDAEFSELDYPR